MSDITYTFELPTLTPIDDSLRNMIDALLVEDMTEEMKKSAVTNIALQTGYTAYRELAIPGKTFRTDTDWHVDSLNGDELLSMIMSSTCSYAAACEVVIAESLQVRATEVFHNKEFDVEDDPSRKHLLRYLHWQFGNNWLEAAADPSLRHEQHEAIDDHVSVRGLEIVKLEPYVEAAAPNAKFLHRSRVRRAAEPYIRGFLRKASLPSVVNNN